MEIALSYIPADSEYARAARSVIQYHDQNPAASWRDCFQYVHDYFGYGRYPGACHIIPNCAVMALSLIYGGDFDQSLNICNMRATIPPSLPLTGHYNIL